MIPLRITGATHVMHAPPGNDDVRDLHVRVEGGVYLSRWEPTPAELALLNAGGSVELAVLGGQPTVSIAVRPHAEYGD